MFVMDYPRGATRMNEETARRSHTQVFLVRPVTAIEIHFELGF